MKGTFFIKNHQHKGQPFQKGLEARGYTSWPFRNFPDFALYDHEHGAYGYGFNNQLSILQAKNRPVFTYPHSARAGYPYTLRETWPDILCRFVFSEGSKQIMRMCGVPGPIEVVGWAWSDIKPFIEPDIGDRLKILFCPIHPNENGFLHDIDKKVNEDSLNLLAQLRSDYDITVRYLGSLESQGLWKERGLDYVLGKPDGSHIGNIEKADIVIGAYTLAYTSIALGKPTIMIGEISQLHSGNATELMRFSETEPIWKEFSRYPYNLEDVGNSVDGIYAMIGSVLRFSPEIELWSRQFIGDPFDEDIFVNAIEHYMKKAKKPTNTFLQTKGYSLDKLPGSLVEPRFVPKEPTDA